MAFTIDNAECLRESAKAILVDAPVFDEPTWIPQSQIDDDSEVYKLGTTGSLIVSDYLAEQRGWL